MCGRIVSIFVCMLNTLRTINNTIDLNDTLHRPFARHSHPFRLLRARSHVFYKIDNIAFARWIRRHFSSHCDNQIDIHFKPCQTKEQNKKKTTKNNHSTKFPRQRSAKCSAFGRCWPFNFSNPIDDHINNVLMFRNRFLLLLLFETSDFQCSGAHNSIDSASQMIAFILQ